MANDVIPLADSRLFYTLIAVHESSLELLRLAIANTLQHDLLS